LADHKHARSEASHYEKRGYSDWRNNPFLINPGYARIDLQSYNPKFVIADWLFFRLAALESLDVAPAIPAFFALPAKKIAASYFHKSHVVRLYKKLMHNPLSFNTQYS